MTFELRLQRQGTKIHQSLAATRTVQSDEVDIQRTMAVFCHAVDRGASDVWADCFTEDGIYRVERPTGDAFNVVGRAALRAYSAAHEGPPQMCLKHMTMAPIIELDGDTATATAMFAVLQSGTDGPFVDVYGRYEDILARGAEGVWRFKQRTAILEVSAATNRAAVRRGNVS